ncbi:MAG: 6-phosphogluconolactonase [Candidatus Acidiferrales bacterium]
MGESGASRKSRPPVSRQIIVCADVQAVAREGARRFVDAAQRAVAEYGRFCVALAGGKSPAPMYRLLGSEEFRGEIDWRHARVFWCDERAVPPDHAESNYALAHREWISRVPMAPSNVYRMPAERADIEAAAADYEALVRTLVPPGPAAPLPSFDLLLLGVGADGHTASLFPGAPELAEAQRLVCATRTEHHGWRRMTFTLPLINAARQVMFLISGGEKAARLRQVIEPDREPSLPAARVQPSHGNLIILADRDASSLLNPTLVSGRRGEQP